MFKLLKIVSVLCIIGFMGGGLVGCGTALLPIKKPASDCDGVQPEESVLCAYANAMNVSLEVTGEVFVALNAEAILDHQLGAAYTKQKALALIEKLRLYGPMAAGEIDVAELGRHVGEMVSKHPILRLGTTYILADARARGVGRYFTARDLVYWKKFCDDLESQVLALPDE
jgi:hypothetical protein